MSSEAGMIAKDARQAPLESALKELHHALVTVEEQSSNLEAKLKRIMVQQEVINLRGSGDYPRDGRPTMAPERPRSEMTIEVQQLAQRLAALADRISRVYQNVDC